MDKFSSCVMKIASYETAQKFVSNLNEQKSELNAKKCK